MESIIFYSYTPISGIPITVDFNKNICEIAKENDLQNYINKYDNVGIDELRQMHKVDMYDISKFDQDTIDDIRLWILENNSAIINDYTKIIISKALIERENELNRINI